MQTFTTPGGHEVTRVSMPDAAYDQLVVFWPNTAAFDVPGKEGLATLAARLPFEGFAVDGETYDFDRFDEELKDAEQSIRLNNALHGTALAIASPAGEGFEPAASIARGVLFAPSLEGDDLARVQGQIPTRSSARSAIPACWPSAPWQRSWQARTGGARRSPTGL